MRRALGWVGRVLRRVAIVLLVVWGAACVALLSYRVLPPPYTMVQLQRVVEGWMDGTPITLQRRWVAASALPSHVAAAVVAAEDARFYEHHGFDFVEQRKAAEDAIEGRRVRGASTLTQQLVKNLFFTTHPSVVRKAAELSLTIPAELLLGKGRILELYLNTAEWGPGGVFGIDAAARHWYGVPATQLSRAQAIRLAAILPSPRRRAPARMDRMAEIIEGRMRQMGW
jgi:monofunctional biosynthetic peptidoglycan transglycosylase